MVVYSFCRRDALGQVVYEFTWENYGRIVSAWYVGLILRTGGWALLGAGVAWGVARYGTRALAWLEDLLYNRHRAFVACVAAAVWFGAMRGEVYSREAPVDAVRYLRTLFLSIEYSFWSTFLCVLIGYPVAYFIGRAPAGARNVLLMAVMIPFWTNFLIRTYAWITILKGEGLLNGLLVMARIVPEPLEILYSPTAVMIGLVYTYLPFMILPIYGSVEKLDGAMIEAAFDLGASPVRAFWNVIVPLTRPGIMAGVLLVFIPAVGQFAINDILGGRSKPLIGNVIEQQFRAARNPPFGAALSITLLVMFVAVFWLAGRRRASIIE
jgi:spermidine/putrescine transport system permease protein